MVLNANILKNWTSVTEISVGIFQSWRTWSLTKSISQVVWKRAKKVNKIERRK